MSGRFFAIFAWMLWALTAATVIMGIVLLVSVDKMSLDNVIVAIAFNAFPFIGALIVAQRQRNAIGWICLAIGIGTTLTFFDACYMGYTTELYRHPNTFSVWLDWVGNMVWPLNLSLAAALMLLFPTGRPISPRLNWLVWALWIDTVPLIVSYAVLPGPFSGETTINPAGLPALEWISVPVNSVAQVGQFLILLAAAGTAVWRFFRSRGVEREQMKWFAYGVAVLVVCVVLTTILLPEGNNTLFAIGVIMLPIGIGIAVLRYRLYNIDVIIRRTLIYGVLTVILAALYFAVVLSAQIVGDRLARQAQPPAWLIVVTTLVIAALFTPLRRRIQRLIDRQFIAAATTPRARSRRLPPPCAPSWTWATCANTW
jgi:hypothetical protein